MTPLQWTTTPSGAITAQAFGFKYRIENQKDLISGYDYWFAFRHFPGVRADGEMFDLGRFEDIKQSCQYHSDAVASAIDVAMEEKQLIKFPQLTAGTANAIAYQLEIGRENHSCPVDDAAIAAWLRDLANQLDPSDKLRGNDGYHHPISKTPPTKETK